MKIHELRVAGSSLFPGLPTSISRRGKLRAFREWRDKHSYIGVYPCKDGEGSVPGGRQDNYGASVVTPCLPTWSEYCRRGMAFEAGDGGNVTLTVALGTTAPLTLFNPLQSQVKIVLIEVTLTYYSGTMPAGTVFHVLSHPLLPSNTAGAQTAGINVAPSSGTQLIAFPGDFGSMNTSLYKSPQGIVRSGATVTTPATTNSLIYPWFSTLPILASTANNPFEMRHAFDGTKTLEMGAQYQVQAVCGGAGSSPKVAFGIKWAELPIY